MISWESVLNRVYNFARVCPNYKQGIACPKQGNKIEVVVLNRVCILGFFCPKQGQGYPQWLTYTQIWVEYPHPGTNISRKTRYVAYNISDPLLSQSNTKAEKLYQVPKEADSKYLICRKRHRNHIKSH